MIQHAACEAPGLVGNVLRSEGWEINLVRTYRRDPVPACLDGNDGLVILGGPMSVYDTEGHPYLAAELRLIESAARGGQPVLGICLGSQLLAAALGAAVVPNYQREIGWHEVHFTRSAAKDPLWRGMARELTAFHWHGDRFELPARAESLAWSNMTDCQAFRWGRAAYGLLFHLEVDQGAVRRMTKAFQAELLMTGQRPADIETEAEAHLPNLHRVGEEFLRRWLRLTETS